VNFPASAQNECPLFDTGRMASRQKVAARFISYILKKETRRGLKIPGIPGYVAGTYTPKMLG
jgi:hypothetical protein